MCGVPHLTSYTVYHKDLPYVPYCSIYTVNVSDKLKFVLFADYKSILYSTKEIENVEDTVNIKMSKIHEWLCTNTAYSNIFILIFLT